MKITKKQKWKPMKIYRDPLKPMQYDESPQRTRSPAWNRAKVSIGAEGRPIPSSKIHAPKPMKCVKIYENP